MTASTIESPTSPSRTADALRRFVPDTRAVFRREIMLVLRDPLSLGFSLLQPLVFLALFGPLLAGTVGGGGIGGSSALQWFLPGVVVMICVFGTGMTGTCSTRCRPGRTSDCSPPHCHAPPSSPGVPSRSSPPWSSRRC